MLSNFCHPAPLTSLGEGRGKNRCFNTLISDVKPHTLHTRYGYKLDHEYTIIYNHVSYTSTMNPKVFSLHMKL